MTVNKVKYLHHMQRKRIPNILIIGTVGVGKSYLCNKLAYNFNLKWLDVSKIALDNRYLTTFDELYECPIVDKVKLIDGIEDDIENGGNIVEYHNCELFPPKWFEIVIVVRTDHRILIDRLEKRSYNEFIIDDLVKNELQQSSLEQALNNFKSNIVHQVRSNSESDAEEALLKIKHWYKEELETVAYIDKT